MRQPDKAPAWAEAAVPSSASSARPRDIETQVKIGVSRRVKALDSDVAQLLDEVEEAVRLVGLERNHELLVVDAERVRGVDRDVRDSVRPISMCSVITRRRSSRGSRYHSRFLSSG